MSTPLLFSCPYLRTRDWTRCTLHGLAPTYLTHVSFSSRPSTLPLSTAIVCLWRSLKFRSCGYRAQAMIILLNGAYNLSRCRAVQLRQRIREHDQLIRGKPRNNNLALLSSCQNREALRILQPLICGHRLQMLLATLRMRLTSVGQNRRAPTQLSEKKWNVKKRRAQICGQIQRFIKISTELRRQTRTSTTHTKHKRSACSRKPN